MKKSLRIFLSSLALSACLVFISSSVSAKNPKKDIYQVKIYTLKNNEQVAPVDAFLKNAFLPALHRAGILKIGVFKPITNDTAAIKKIYVLIPFTSAAQWKNISGDLDKDASYQSASKDFTGAAFDHAPFERLESILLEAFDRQPHFIIPSLKNSASEKIYELRSYESPTEALHVKKVKMFNEGGETIIFKRLGFNAVFYAKVISGSRMPNLMYMTSFENMAEHDEHWKAFSNDAEWKRISALPEYESKVSVSHMDKILMHATDYSDL
jgi:hypothetical protein